ncbi:putative glycolipid-binding domain-containing protein [Brevibacillus porteri]|uniref:Transcriptional regulator n=1 Tax=Brevibacillus porteri TaxID=2126350 RepID=A0ABX5FVI6_9BACL|nr:putative glycolipid-binding domain-containing protein [Brevibacillus porteri]MED1797225.1 putative glycolipid-binding domain-containing protein [Brevibacillus porteri]MED2133758.1 putative glycolipid-binding domain-containing protein [Brevibacillus porteri]MED2746896.1 putative glycolipid-binding domain-containing protein [Brevibacillus porteri]MED2816034.1 putative glycolipid-binding domain-containing protein [Brevibacillus porteri]MED2894720.1 putative glycolipid-binding domain-containing
MLPTNVIWKPTTGVGYEHLRIREGSNRIHVNSIVIGRLDDATLTRIQYEIVLDSNWVTREVSLASMGEEGALHLSSDGEGNWTNEVGEPIPELFGCIDIDISCTPFTNTLPIRRLSYTQLEPQYIQVAYFSAHELTYRQVQQQYTLLESKGDSSVYQYRAGTFMENITVDSNGLVLIYPELFLREQL